MNDKFETKLHEAVKSAIYDCDDNAIVDAWNDNVVSDSKIHPMEDFDEACDEFNSMSPREIVREVQQNFDYFDSDDDWFYMDYGTYKSTCDLYDVVDRDDLAQAVIDGEVEIDGLDLDEIKRELMPGRPFKDKEEFEQHTGIVIGSPVTIRHKEVDTVIEGMLISITVYEGSTTLVIGKTDFTLKVLFDNWEYKKDDEWVPFGVLDVTDTEKTEDNSNED